MSIKFKKLNNSIIKCKKCPRLIKFSKKISIIKRKQHIDEIYWGKPVVGFGDFKAKLMILGLAPAAHGGTRTGRAFTGDKSGDFLFNCLYKAGLSSLSSSTHINDGLKLKDTYITNILKCVPPEDKPLIDELKNCSNFFDEEIRNLKNLKVIICLGKIAFDNCFKFYKNFFKRIEKLLNNDGVSIIHTIGSVNPPRDPHPWITKYIFPGGYTPSLSEVVTPVEKAGLIVSDIEVLKLHYSHTLRHWKNNCIKNKAQIIEMFDEKFFRMWEFYLASCESAFKWGDQVVYQFQLTKNYTSTPVTRDYIYD